MEQLNKMKEQNLIIIKPDGVKKHLVGECLRRFEKKGIEIIDLKVSKLSKKDVRIFYAHLKPKLPRKLFESIVSYLSSGKVVIVIIKGEDIFKKTKNICGVTNPKEAKKGTIRGDFSTDDLNVSAKKLKATKNIIHFSDNKKDFRQEIKLLRKLLK
ncbi:hypothetical protein CMI46_02720 [Candidatus Pacearchaeota archaeon]|nr:hypothetical protein [Candidatus Pacearchaeota archaeon]